MPTDATGANLVERIADAAETISEGDVRQVERGGEEMANASEAVLQTDNRAISNADTERIKFTGKDKQTDHHEGHGELDVHSRRGHKGPAESDEAHDVAQTLMLQRTRKRRPRRKLQRRRDQTATEQITDDEFDAPRPLLNVWSVGYALSLAIVRGQVSFDTSARFAHILSIVFPAAGECAWEILRCAYAS